MVITAEQYKFYKRCIENNDTKSERQMNYFKRTAEEYELNEEYKNENKPIQQGWYCIDYVEILFVGILTCMVYNFIEDFPMFN